MPPLHRRDLVLGAAALATTASPAVSAPAPGTAPPPPASPDQAIGPVPPPPEPPNRPVIYLWPDEPPGGSGPVGSETINNGGAVTNIIHPRMVVQRPPKPNGAAVLILGGGGYRRIGIAKESQTTANWLNEYGVTAFILYYRLPNDGWPLLSPFQDVQRALRLIRFKADELGIDESQIGIIGYSAGGHCAGMVSVQPGAPWYRPVDDADAASARPDFTGLIYPVLTMMPPNRTRISTLTLLGANPTLATSAQWSVDLHVTDDAPTTFLVHATDDPIAPVENSLLMFTALRRVHVPVEMHVFRSGGHGFNLGKPGNEGHQWPHLFATWAGFTKA